MWCRLSMSLANAPKRSGKTEGKLLKLNRYRSDKKELERFMASYGRLKNYGAVCDGDFCLKSQIEKEKVRLCKKVQLMLKRTRIIDMAIEDMADGTLSLLLRYRYIDGLGWEEITEELCYSKRNIFYLHKKALEALAL